MERQTPRARQAPAAMPPSANLPQDGDRDRRSTPVPENADDFLSLGSTRIIPGGNLIGEDAEGTSFQEETDITIANKPRQLSSLGDYRLLKKLGQGAMGAVYKARKLDSELPVAIKVLYPHIAANPKLVARLVREGQVMGQLDHPNLIAAYATDEDQGWHYIVMEYVRGESLQKWIDRLGRLPIGDAIQITLACARALDYAHALGLVHRDVKPDNILISRIGEVKLTDLGMVKTHDEDMSLTQTGHAVGTPWYMPLEQARNAKETDGRCDIYALGCVLYCMLTGHPPFTGKTLVEVIQAKEGGTFPAARQYNPEVPERLDLILLKMTAKLPRYRYSTCQEVIADLEGLGLASTALTFLEDKSDNPPSHMGEVLPASESPAAVLTDDWFLRVHQPDGKTGIRKLTTVQLKKMLEEGTVEATAKVSHLADEGFRAVGTYKEFQSTALAKHSRKAADQQAVRYRNLYRKIEEKDRVREDFDKNVPEAMPDYSALWTPAVIIAGSFVLLILLWYFLANLI